MNGSLPELGAEEMVEGGLTDEAVLCHVAYRKVVIPVRGYVLHGTLQGLIVGDAAFLHLWENDLQYSVEQGICLKPIGKIPRQKLAHFKYHLLCLLVAENALGLKLKTAVMYEGADVNYLYVGLTPPLGVAVDVLGNENNVTCRNLQSLSVIDVRARALEDDTQSRLPFVAVSAAKVIVLEAVS